MLCRGDYVRRTLDNLTGTIVASNFGRSNPENVTMDYGEGGIVERQ